MSMLPISVSLLFECSEASEILETQKYRNQRDDGSYDVKQNNKDDVSAEIGGRSNHHDKRSASYDSCTIW